MQLKHFLQFNDFSHDEFEYLFERTRWIKNEFKQYQRYWPLEDRTLAMIFDKHSTRTRLSFEAGMHQLGGKAIIVFNEQTKMIFFSSDVVVSPGVLSLGDLYLTIDEKVFPVPADKKGTEAFEGGTKMGVLMKTLQQFKATPEQLFDIMWGLKEAGRLHAEILIQKG